MSEETDLLIGAEISGCKILSKIGAGGMGSVYKAHHVMLDKEVCIKILAPNLAQDERYVQFFLREARSVAKLEHPNIVQVYNVGKDPGTKHYFLIMSLINGQPLSDIIDQKGPLKLDDAFKIATGVLSGLSAAHAASIIHRDIKPSNLLITSEGDPKIVDFGLARSINEDKQLTMAGEMVGTAYFMAPEQGLGAKVDHRADLYALGGTYFYMLTGQYIFQGKTSIEVIHKHISEPPPSILKFRPDTPLNVSRVIDKLLRKKPEERFQTAKEALDALKSAAPTTISTNPYSDSLDAITLAGTSEVLPPSGAIPSMSKMRQNAKEDIAAVSARIPEVCSFDEMFSEQIQKNSPAAMPTSAKKQENVPPPPPQAQVQIKGQNAQKAKASPAQPGDDKIELATNIIVYILMSLLTLGNALLLGSYCIHSMAPNAQGLNILISPWTGTEIPQAQMVLLGTTILLLLLTAFRNKSIFSISGISVALMTLAGFSAAILGGNPVAHKPLTVKVMDVVDALKNNLSSGNHLFIYAFLCYILGVNLASRIKGTLLTKLTGTILSVASIICLWRFSMSVQGQTAAIWGYAALVLTIGGAAISMMKKSSFFSIVGPAVLFTAAFASTWIYSVTPYANAEADHLLQKQETAIQLAKAMQHQKDVESGFSEQPTMEIPKALTKDQIYSDVIKTAVFEPAKRFHKNAPAAGSYLLLALLLLVITNTYYIASLFRKSGPQDFEVN